MVGYKNITVNVDNITTIGIPTKLCSNPLENGRNSGNTELSMAGIDSKSGSTEPTIHAGRFKKLFNL